MKILAVNGHYEAFDDQGNFLGSGDTYAEAARSGEEDS